MQAGNSPCKEHQAIYMVHTTKVKTEPHTKAASSITEGEVGFGKGLSLYYTTDFFYLTQAGTING